MAIVKVKGEGGRGSEGIGGGGGWRDRVPTDSAVHPQ